MDQKNIKKKTPVLDAMTELAVMRTHLAAERTLMAWIRTAFSMIGMGFAIFKFFQFLFQANPSQQHISGTRHLGLFLILLGTLSLIPGIIEHIKVLNYLHFLNTAHKRWSYALILAVLVGVIGVYALSHAITADVFAEAWFATS